MEDITRNNRKERTGIVLSNKMQKSIVIGVRRRFKHVKYGKFMLRMKKYMVHDEKEEAGVGDVVQIMETRPLSKQKRWRLLNIIEKAK